MPRGSRRNRRQRVEWYRNFTKLSYSTQTVSSVLVPNSEIREMTSPTLVRVRGAILHSVSTVGSNTIAAVGLIVLTESALTGGLPFPISDQDADWLLYEWMPSHNTTESTGRFWRQPIDNRAKRRINEDEAIVLVIETDIAAAHVTLGGFSLLLKQV